MTPISHLLEAKRAIHDSEDAERIGRHDQSVQLALQAIKHLHAWAIEVARMEAEEMMAVRNVIDEANHG